jgi:hypothetical protein
MIASVVLAILLAFAISWFAFQILKAFIQIALGGLLILAIALFFIH